MRGHADLVQAVPLRDYEGFKPYVDRILFGEDDVLWPGKPTSARPAAPPAAPSTSQSPRRACPTTSAARAGPCYIAHSGRADFVDGKMIFLQGSPVLDRSRRIPTSGIVANHVPAYLLKNRMPGFATNRIADWETKVEAIVGETMQADMPTT